MNLISESESFSAPPDDVLSVLTVTFEYPPTPEVAVNTFAPFGSVESATNAVSMTIFPLVNFLPVTSSPKRTSYFPFSASSRK